MFKKLALIIILFSALISRAENVYLYNDNGQGGIHRSVGSLVLDEGQYFVNFSRPSYNGNENLHLKVYKVKESAELLLDQPSWAAKYAYMIEEPGWNGTKYYFNMKSRWIPSQTVDTNDPNYVLPCKKIKIRSASSDYLNVVWVKSNHKDYLYYGDPFFYAIVERNKIDRYSPAWASQYKYTAIISGIYYYFNLP